VAFARRGPLTLEGFANSGADWLDRFKPYIEDGSTIVVSPHKVFGPETNDLILQLGKRGIRRVILGGMLANMCVEAHLRELLERGSEMAVVKDATAGPRRDDVLVYTSATLKQNVAVIGQVNVKLWAITSCHWHAALCGDGERNRERRASPLPYPAPGSFRFEEGTDALDVWQEQAGGNSLTKQGDVR
jgi:hypothetical protein